MLHALLILLSGAAAPASPGYVWPLKLEPQLTSSFAEYRPGRFHAGIDLRTNGVGREVFAADDGYISRVRCSPFGYGKAIYLQLADGNSAVYGHLSDYYPELLDVVRAEQHRTKSYTVDIALKPGQFPVKRGQRIALSGQTGIGAPHLHYELRNAKEEPINPRLLGVDWPDTTPPVIRKILLSPKGLEGRVNGDVLPVALAVTKSDKGELRTAPVRASGLIGFGADVIDPGAGGYNLGGHELRLLADGKEAFRMQHDLLSYNNHRNAAVSYHPQMRDEGRFLLLWRWPGNRCDSYQHCAGDGWVKAPDGGGDFVVEASDFLGNTINVTVPVLPDKAGSVPGTAGQGVDFTPLGPDLLISVRLPKAVAESPQLTLDGVSAPFTAIHDTLYRGLFTPKKSGLYTLRISGQSVTPVTQQVAAWVQDAPAATLALGDLRISAGPDAPYGVLILRGWTVASPPPHAMKARSDAYEIWPDTSPLFENVTASFPLDPGQAPAPNIHVYRSKGTSWSRMDTTFDDGRAIFKTDELGVFMAMEDDTAPGIASASPAEGFHCTSRRPEIRTNVSDEGSGIAEFSITCGEQWLLTAFDPEHGEIRWEQDEDLPSGTQTLSFILTDAAGNTRHYERKVIVP